MNEEIPFESKQEALKLLENSRKEIDKIDNELIDLISLRTSLAKDIVCAKIYLDMDIYDKSREDLIHKKTTELANKKNLDSEILNQIMDMLTILSKNEQKEILRRTVDGKY